MIIYPDLFVKHEEMIRFVHETWGGLIMTHRDFTQDLGFNQYKLDLICDG
jgi:hypothetical protein